MATPQELLDRIQTAMPAEFREERTELAFQTEADARDFHSRIVLAKRDLGLIRREISSEIKAINARYTAERAAKQSPVATGFMRGLFGARTVGRANAIAKQNLRNKQIEERAPYEKLIALIDQIVLSIDKAKIQVDQLLPKKK